METTPWTRCCDRLPDEDVEVETKIDNSFGCRNETTLKLHNRLWFFPDMSMYVYYTPTHWRSLNATTPKESDPQ